MEIKYLSKNLNNKIILDIYNTINFLEKQYPNFNVWFNKIKKEIDGINREIIYIESNSILLGLVILKNTSDEKKICTIFVKEEYRNSKLGTMLLKEGFEFLKTTTPLITIPENSLHLFEKIIKKYNWKYSETTYIYNTPEQIFNKR